MGTPAFVLLAAGLFAAIGGLILAGPRRAAMPVLAGMAHGPALLRLAAYAALALSLWAAGAALGWEAGIPIWLCLLMLAAVAALFLAAVSRRWHLALSGIAALVALGGGVYALVAG